MFAPHKHLLSAALASHPLLMSGLFWLTHNYSLLFCNKLLQVYYLHVGNYFDFIKHSQKWEVIAVEIMRTIIETIDGQFLAKNYY